MVGILSLGDVSRSAPSDLLSEIVKSVVFLQMHPGTNSTGRVTLATDRKRTDDGAILNRSRYSAATGMGIGPPPI